MIWIILIAIIGYLLYSFISSKEKIKQQVDAQGGMKEKYFVLINYLLGDVGARIIHLTRDNVQIQAKTRGFVSHFSILQSFDKVLITWQAITPFGEFKDRWQFPQTLDQHQMVKKISADIEFKFDNYVDHDELSRRINQAMDKL
jgi:hypothetical protein